MSPDAGNINLDLLSMCGMVASDFATPAAAVVRLVEYHTDNDSTLDAAIPTAPAQVEADLNREIEHLVKEAWLRAEIATLAARSQAQSLRGVPYRQPQSKPWWLPFRWSNGERRSRDHLGDAVAQVVQAADVARDMHQWQTAAKNYRAALDIEPDNAPILVQYGHALKESGDVRSAECAYRKSLDIDPRNADTHLQLGHALKIQGRRDEAVNSYLRAVALDKTLGYPSDELIALGWTTAEIDDVLRLLCGHERLVLAPGDATPAPHTVKLFAPHNWADVGSQPIVVLEVKPPSPTLKLIVNFIRLADIISSDRVDPVVVVSAQPHDRMGCMWVARCPELLDSGAYIVTVTRDPHVVGIAVGGIHISRQDIKDPIIVSPNDWANVPPHPEVTVQSDDFRDLAVNIIKWTWFNKTGVSAIPAVSGAAKYDPALGLHRYLCDTPLDDGPYAVIVRNNGRGQHAEGGFHVDSYIDLRHNYNAWIKRDHLRLSEECPLLAEHAKQMVYMPIFIVVIETFTGGSIAETLASIEKQIYRHWQLRLIHSEDWADMADLSEGDFIVPLRAGDILCPTALYEFANVLNTVTDTDMIYADEDRVSATGEHSEPFHKPDWSPDYLETFNYVGYPACFRRNGRERDLCGDGYFGFVLEFSERAKGISHIRKILCHRSEASLSKSSTEKAIEIRALGARLRRTGRVGEVRPMANYPGGFELRLKLRDTPLVSIVIPTAGKSITYAGRNLDLLLNCVTSIHQMSTYRNFEIILVDNGDLSELQRKGVSGFGCKTVTYRERKFNVSKKLNLGVSHAQGRFLLLMNDDIEIITPDWIERMLEHFMKDNVGVVGVKLCYPDGSIQHAGVVHNYGNPDHVRRGVPCSDPGYFFSTNGVRNYSAVTGAVMMVKHEIYCSLGGYTETLAESFNDVDFCQKARAAGLYVVYTPHAELIHFESQSRVPVLIPEELDYYQERWAHEVTIDPFYNERHLSVAPPTFEPTVNKPIL
jgi:glycosyltransferase involved in cell wall biosynthesis/tetratricopeptide (TPR) repeat protein